VAFSSMFLKRKKSQRFGASSFSKCHYTRQKNPFASLGRSYTEQKNHFTIILHSPLSLVYPLSVFNKNSTLKGFGRGGHLETAELWGEWWNLSEEFQILIPKKSGGLILLIESKLTPQNGSCAQDAAGKGVAVQCRPMLVCFAMCPRLAPAASYAWFCNLIVLLYLRVAVRRFEFSIHEISIVNFIHFQVKTFSPAVNVFECGSH